jgi:hypothetical protein
LKLLSASTLFAASLLFSSISNAQLLSGSGKDSTAPKIEFGLKAGLNMQKVSSDSAWENNYNTGIAGGAFMQIGNTFSFRIEVLAATSRYTFKYLTDSLGNKGDFNALSLNLPVLLQYKFFSVVCLLAGAQYGSMISIKNNGGYSGNAKMLFRSGEFSLLGGIEGRLPLNIIVGARYVYGITDMNNNDNSIFYTEPWKNSAIQAYVGYRIQ